jgi:hypothetical protein
MLRKALPAPHLDWIQEGGEWGISITCAFALWMDMINKADSSIDRRWW